MAILPKVKFQAQAWADYVPPTPFSTVAIASILGQQTQDYVISDETAQEEKAFTLYMLVLLTTTSPADKLNNYSYHSHVCIKSGVDERVAAYKNYALQELDSGNISGYIVKAFRLDPLKSNTMILVASIRKFQMVKKTYLNGPLKDNEFLKKKGEPYA